MKLGTLELTETTTAWGRRLIVAHPAFDDRTGDGETIEAAEAPLDQEGVTDLRDACDRFLNGQPL